METILGQKSSWGLYSVQEEEARPWPVVQHSDQGSAVYVCL